MMQKTAVDYPRVNILGVGVHALDLGAAAEFLVTAAREGRKGYVCVTGAHGIMEARADPELRGIHNRSLLTVPDGMPNVWIGRWRGYRQMGRVYGPDLMLEIFRRTAPSGTDDRKLRHFLYGATPETLEKMAGNLRARFPGVDIAGAFAPPFRPLTPEEDARLAAQVAAARPDFFWVGLSTPKQERFMAAYAPRLAATVLLGVGAAFDIHAGLQADAPAWVKKSGLQWFFRLCQNPRRLWKRYLAVVPAFLWLNLQQAAGLRRFDLNDEAKA